MQTILTFGDSNTHGTPPMTMRGTPARFDAATRWPGVMQAATGCTLIEEGLPGRTACAAADPIMGPHMNGHLGLRIALQSHGPIDVLTIMLGTNDLKAHFGLTPDAITAGVAGLLGLALGDEYQTRHGGFQVLLICPPPVLETGILAAEFQGGAAKSHELSGRYAALALSRGASFLNAGDHITSSPIDGIHLDAANHAALGQAAAQRILSFE